MSGLFPRVIEWIVVGLSLLSFAHALAVCLIRLALKREKRKSSLTRPVLIVEFFFITSPEADAL